MRAMHPLRLTRKLLDPTQVDSEAARIAQTIRSVTQPYALYLFGSAAEGKATDQSDFDFLIVLPDSDSMRVAKRNLRPHMPLAKIPVDLVWVTKNEFERKKDMGGICLVAFTEGRSF